MGILLQATVTWDTIWYRIQDVFWRLGSAGFQLLLAVVIVVVGWGVARLVGAALGSILRAARFDDATRRLIGPSSTGKGLDPSVMMAWAARSGVLVVAVVVAGDVLGFDLSTSVGERLRAVLPRVVSATAELLVGVTLAMILGGLTHRLFLGAGVRGARWRGQAVTVVLSAFAVLLALEQLGLAAQLILALGIATMATVGVAVGLAFGLGCRDLARDFVVEYLRSLDEEPRPRQQ